MNLKHLRKKYLKAQHKANKLRDKYTKLYINDLMQQYVENDDKVMKYVLNWTYGSQCYKDTDSTKETK